MPLTQVQKVGGGTGANSASFTVNYGATPVQGNLLVAIAGSDATLTMTSTGWTLAISQVNNTGLYQWSKIAGAAEATAVTVTPSVSDSVALAVYEFSGNTASPVDKSTSNVGASALTTTATSQADEYAISVHSTSGGTAGVPTTTWTNSFVSETGYSGLASNNPTILPANKVLSATGVVTTTPTPSFNVSSGSVLVTYMATAVVAAAAPTYQPHRMPMGV